MTALLAEGISSGNRIKAIILRKFCPREEVWITNLNSRDLEQTIDQLGKTGGSSFLLNRPPFLEQYLQRLFHPQSKLYPAIHLILRFLGTAEAPVSGICADFLVR